MLDDAANIYGPRPPPGGRRLPREGASGGGGVPLALLRPFSGTGSLAIFQDLVAQNGPDANLTLAAATMYGCSETTFYVIAVYFGSVGIRKTRHAIPAGLVADFVGPLASVAICRAMFGPF